MSATVRPSVLVSTGLPHHAVARSVAMATPRQRANRCSAMHPDAERRAQERLLRWEGEQHPNATFVHTALDFGGTVAAANRSGRLVLVYFFRPDCAACKAMYPKFNQIVGQNPDVQFIKVNTGDEGLLEHCERMGLSRLPYFQLYLGGRQVAHFTCNLSTIARLRAELAANKPDAGHAGGKPPLMYQQLER